MRLNIPLTSLGAVVIVTLLSGCRQVRSVPVPGYDEAPVVTDVYETVPEVYAAPAPEAYAQVPEVYVNQVPEVYAPQAPEAYPAATDVAYGQVSNQQAAEIVATTLQSVIACAEKLLSELGLVGTGSYGSVYGRGKKEGDKTIITTVDKGGLVNAHEVSVLNNALKGVLSQSQILSHDSKIENIYKGGKEHGGRSGGDVTKIKTVNKGFLNVHEAKILDNLLAKALYQAQVASYGSSIVNKDKYNQGRSSGDVTKITTVDEGGLANLHDISILNNLAYGLGEQAQIYAIDSSIKNINSEYKGKAGGHRDRPHAPSHGPRSYDAIQTYVNPSPYEAYTYTAPNPTSPVSPVSGGYQNYPLNYVPGYSYPSTGYYGNNYIPSYGNNNGYGYPGNTLTSNVGQQVYG